MHFFIGLLGTQKVHDLYLTIQKQYSFTTLPTDDIEAIQAAPYLRSQHLLSYAASYYCYLYNHALCSSSKIQVHYGRRINSS